MKLELRLASVVTLLLCVSHWSDPGRAQSPAPQAARPVARPVIVELFTSEGCSSCPPAEDLLEKLATTQPVSGVHVIAIEEHVDYWNGQGWIDPYSSAEWTARQQDYVAKLKEKGGVYTPQMIIDGQSQFVGSRKGEALRGVQESAARANVEVAIRSATSTANDEREFHVSVGRVTGNTDKETADVWLAVTEADLGSAVRGGENAGQTLHHAPVLRMLRKIGSTAAGQASGSAFEGSSRIKIKPGWKAQNLQFIVFVQEKKSGRILGAALAETNS